MRARNIKPGYFKNEDLGTCNPYAQLLFAGLWMLADRAGRLEDRPLRIKAEIFPYRDSTNVDELLTELASLRLITRYEINGERFIQIENFSKHQSPHKTEKLSEIPNKPQENKTTCSGSVIAEGLTEALPPDSLIPDSLNHDSAARAKSDFQKVHEAGSELFPNLMAANNSVIHVWIEAGCDVDRDILPEIQRHKGKNIGAWKYFTNAIMDAKATREAPLPTGKPKQQNTTQGFEASKPVSDDVRLENLRWRKKMGMDISPQDLAFMEARA